jgi:hypothetical protein
MSARSEIDKRLLFISEAVLSDAEFQSIGSPEYLATPQIYSSGLRILAERGGAGNTLERWKAEALSRDNYPLDISTGKKQVESHSNIFIGAAVE